jgi:hypothetical protein
VKRYLFISLLCLFGLNTVSSYTQDFHAVEKRERLGSGPLYGTYNGTMYAMAGWGIGMALAIALIAGFVDPSNAHSH